MRKKMNRRSFMRQSAFGLGVLAAGSTLQKSGCAKATERPNLVFVFGDQWRGQATGYAGDPNAITPNLDKLSGESVQFTNAISGCPVCSPYRASLLTGQYPLTHGIFHNDKPLSPDAVTIAEVYKKAGYDTAYIGKWHVDGHGRFSFIPKERRQGFDFWRVCECTHKYNESIYYADEDKKLMWQGYDAFAQTRVAQEFIREHASGKPFILFLSWGPPHAPYHTAPAEYKNLFDKDKIQLRPNVPENMRAETREDLAGYYAHITALDKCIGDLLQTLDDNGIADNTIFIFTSDHGDMLGSQGLKRKQKPWDESIHVPFLLRYPDKLGRLGKKIDMPINSPDIMPTLLGLSGIKIPDSVEGYDFSGVITGEQEPRDHAVLISCPVPFHQWSYKVGGREYRGVRTRRYTYTRDLNGPWLLYDNEKDPYQLNNLVNKPEYANIQTELEKILRQKLAETHDEFLPGREYMKMWGYEFDAGDL